MRPWRRGEPPVSEGSSEAPVGGAWWGRGDGLEGWARLRTESLWPGWWSEKSAWESWWGVACSGIDFRSAVPGLANAVDPLSACALRCAFFSPAYVGTPLAHCFLWQLISPWFFSRSSSWGRPHAGPAPDFCPCYIFCFQLACWLFPPSFSALASNPDCYMFKNFSGSLTNPLCNLLICVTLPPFSQASWL